MSYKMAYKVYENRKVVLVTGGTGLVGTALKDALEFDPELRKKYQFVFLSSKDGNLVNKNEAEEIILKTMPTIVINLAARVGGLYANMEHKDQFYVENYYIGKNVIELSFKHQVTKCISCLSTCIFPEHIDFPFNETSIHCGLPSSTNSGYATAKRRIDILSHEHSAKLHDFTKKFSLFTSVIPTNVYGKNDNFDLREAHVVPSLIHKAYQAIKCHDNNKLKFRNKNPILRVCGSGYALRQFIYAPDLARLILWSMDNYNEIEPIILAPDLGEEYTIKQVAETIADCYFKILGVKLELIFEPSFNDGQHRKTASNAKLRKYLPDFQFTPLTEGLEQTINWFCDNYYSIRRK